MQQGVSIVRQLIAGEERNTPATDRLQTLEQHVGMRLIAFAHDKSGYQAPCWRKSDPHPRITIERQNFLSDGQMRFFLAHEAPQFVQLALSDMYGVKQICGHRSTM